MKPKKKNIAKKHEKLSSGTNKANSFKSVTSYVLGDLDIEKDDNNGSESFEISSNTSAVKSEEGQNEKDAVSFLSSRNDTSAKKPVINDATLLYRSFAADKSPFSFKNPIFFSCPQGKQQRQDMLNSAKPSKKVLFTNKKKEVAQAG